MAAVKLFWGNNMVDVTSREKGIYVYNAEKSRFVHEVIVLSKSEMFSSKEGYQNVLYDNMTIECESRNMKDS